MSPVLYPIFSPSVPIWSRFRVRGPARMSSRGTSPTTRGLRDLLVNVCRRLSGAGSARAVRRAGPFCVATARGPGSGSRTRPRPFSRCRLRPYPVTHLLHEPVFEGRAFGVSGRRRRFGPFAARRWGCTPWLRHEGQVLLDFRPRSVHEIRVLLTTPIRSGLQPVVPGSASPAVSPLSGECPDRVTRQPWPITPSADFCARVGAPHGSPSPHPCRTERRPPGVSLVAFPAHLPDLQPGPWMDVDFATRRPLVRPRMPRIRFLFVRSRFCCTLPSDPASRRRPCASLALRLHQAVQRTCTSKLPDMPGTRLNRFAVDARSRSRSSGVLPGLRAGCGR